MRVKRKLIETKKLLCLIEKMNIIYKILPIIFLKSLENVLITKELYIKKIQI